MFGFNHCHTIFALDTSKTLLKQKGEIFKDMAVILELPFFFASYSCCLYTLWNSLWNRNQKIRWKYSALASLLSRCCTSVTMWKSFLHTGHGIFEGRGTWWVFTQDITAYRIRDSSSFIEIHQFWQITEHSPFGQIWQTKKNYKLKR